MDLWIRSQYKEMLFKVNNSLRIRYNGDNEICFVECDGHKIALYKTRARALEVLDEIQKKITNIGLSISFGSPMIDLKNPFMVYEMPKE